MELFAGRGPASAASGDEGGGDRRFPEPPPRYHAREEDSSTMLVIRDALLAQLQKDRLRQEIILAELAKIERAMALRTAGAERANPGAPFCFLEETPHSREAVGRADYGIVAADVDNGLKKKKDGELESQKPATEGVVRECLKTCDARNAADQQNAALDESNLQKPNETTLPKKMTPSSVKWSCDICQVGAPTEGHLQQHFAGQKHQSKVTGLVSRNKACNSKKAKAPAVKSENVRQYDEKPRLTWICRFCQSNCTCKSDLVNHLRGKRHKAKIQSLLEECKNMAVDCGSLNSQPNIVTRDEDSNPALTWNCNLCQAKCTCKSNLVDHLRGKRHQLNFLLLQVEGKQYLSEWFCGVCQTKCNSVSQFENHCSSRGHQQNVEALRLKGGGQIASSSGFKAPKGASSEETEIHRVTYFCKLCNLHCNSKNTLAEHRKGKKHTDKVEKRMSLSFCEVCNLQCNSEKMLAHHRTGKAHLAKLNNC